MIWYDYKFWYDIDVMWYDMDDYVIRYLSLALCLNSSGGRGPKACVTELESLDVSDGILESATAETRQL